MGLPLTSLLNSFAALASSVDDATLNRASVLGLPEVTRCSPLSPMLVAQDIGRWSQVVTPIFGYSMINIDCVVVDADPKCIEKSIALQRI